MVGCIARIGINAVVNLEKLERCHIRVLFFVPLALLLCPVASRVHYCSPVIIQSNSLTQDLYVSVQNPYPRRKSSNSKRA